MLRNSVKQAQQWPTSTAILYSTPKCNLSGSQNSDHVENFGKASPTMTHFHLLSCTQRPNATFLDPKTAIMLRTSAKQAQQWPTSTCYLVLDAQKQPFWILKQRSCWELWQRKPNNDPVHFYSTPKMRLSVPSWIERHIQIQSQALGRISPQDATWTSTPVRQTCGSWEPNSYRKRKSKLKSTLPYASLCWIRDDEKAAAYKMRRTGEAWMRGQGYHSMHSTTKARAWWPSCRSRVYKSRMSTKWSAVLMLARWGRGFLRSRVEGGWCRGGLGGVGWEGGACGVRRVVV